MHTFVMAKAATRFWSSVTSGKARLPPPEVAVVEAAVRSAVAVGAK
jgi:hypothetical protein